MLDWEEKRRKASGTMQIVPLLTSSSPMGQAQMGPLGGGRNRHRWLQPLLLWAQGFVPVKSMEIGQVSSLLFFSEDLFHIFPPPSFFIRGFVSLAQKLT